MRIRVYSILIVALFSGCASFKELQPIPPVRSTEGGFIELQNDEENFLLMAQEKYFVKFPRSSDNHFYLVLETNLKKRVHNYLTATFNDGEGPIEPIPDETAGHDSMSVFPIDTSSAFFYWVIDTVSANVALTLRYRYVPQWRYTVENRYDEYRGILAENTLDKRTYESIGPQFDFAAFNIPSEKTMLQERNSRLSQMNDELVRLESVFPANIASSRDTLYQLYVGLNKETRDELQFQSDYRNVLTVLQYEADTRGNLEAFMGNVSEFVKFFEQRNRFRKPVVDHVQSLCLRRLGEALPSYDAQIRKVNDLSAMNLKPSINDVERLYIACDEKLPQQLDDVRQYALEFNNSIQSLRDARDAFEGVNSALQQTVLWPADGFYPDLLAKLDGAKKMAPEFSPARYPRYRTTAASTLLALEIQKVAKSVDDRQKDFRRASESVGKINTLRPPKEYRGIIRILRENRDLGFLLAHYPDIDELLLKLLAGRIQERVVAQQWRIAEEELAELMNDREYLNLSAISSAKLEKVKALEGQVFDQVKRRTSERVDAFVKQHEMTIENVASLYSDSAFLPVYTLTFSSESAARLAQNRKTIEDYVNQAKTIRFPENSIKPIFRELTRAPQERGVEKARAILDHDKFYKGQDKTVRTIIDECNPLIAKTLNKPKEYRRLFVVPVNEGARSSNDYMFRVNVKIPSEAKFPVFDINVKVPQEIASKAGTEQWFTEMTLNKKAVKTEGHMRVVAPTADNDFVAQITPVQMEKNRENIIEIRFKYPSFKLFEVSVMAQVPLIRKN
ncbi:MAG: hypothetical protein HYY49_00610 [Ignavibacteriales bacterium]|nr:hypothetical protein [Ignavibacteriales bacterium]